jgi:O-6-methylguanine DNA methyltransferase
MTGAASPGSGVGGAGPLISGVVVAPWDSSVVSDPKAIRRGWAETPWGSLRIVWRDREILRCGFEAPSPGATPTATWESRATLDPAGAAAWAHRWMEGRFDPAEGIILRLRGTPFQTRVWRALVGIPRGTRVSYGGLAVSLGIPGAARAIGAACGANPLALWVPCHRVVRADGGLHGYRWGLDRKRDLLAWESHSPAG